MRRNPETSSFSVTDRSSRILYSEILHHLPVSKLTISSFHPNMPNSERLFVDLVFRASKKYPSWDPEIPVAVGDYGRISEGRRRGWKFWQRSRGTFIKDGNIYEEKIAENYDIPQPKEHGTSSSEGVTWITSKNVKEVGLDIDAGA